MNLIKLKVRSASSPVINKKFTAQYINLDNVALISEDCKVILINDTALEVDPEDADVLKEAVDIASMFN